MKYAICMWENIASPHQSYFFKALAAHKEVDLQVRYFERFHVERVQQGWCDNNQMPANEQYVDADVNTALETVADWKKCIHVIPGNSYDFTDALIHRFIENGVKWIHWSERSGISLAKRLTYSVGLFSRSQHILSKIAKKRYAELLNTKALGVFAQGELAEQDFLGWGVQKDKIAHLYYTVGPVKKPRSLPDELKTYNDKRIFLFAGSLDKRKGVDLLIRGFARLTMADDWRLILVGQDKSNGKYEKLTARLGIQKNVVFTGAKKMEDIPGYIGNADVFILPTRFDGWGAVLNEAAALGKPIISTDQCGAAFHLIRPGKNGYRIKAGSVVALANAMQEYVNAAEEITVHGQESEKLYYADFIPERNVERFLVAVNKWMNEKNDETVN